MGRRGPVLTRVPGPWPIRGPDWTQPPIGHSPASKRPMAPMGPSRGRNHRKKPFSREYKYSVKTTDRNLLGCVTSVAQILNPGANKNCLYDQRIPALRGSSRGWRLKAKSPPVLSAPRGSVEGWS
jgi:hypothetical protein